MTLQVLVEAEAEGEDNVGVLGRLALPLGIVPVEKDRTMCSSSRIQSQPLRRRLGPLVLLRGHEALAGRTNCLGDVGDVASCLGCLAASSGIG